MQLKRLRLFGSIITLYLASFGQFLYNSAALYIFWPLAFIFSGLPFRKVVREKYFKYYATLWIPFLISWGLAVDVDRANSEIKMMLGVVLTALTFFSLGQNRKTIPWLYGAFIVFYAGMIYYVQIKGILIGFDYMSQRLSIEGLNANFFGYYTFYLTFTVFILGDILINPMMKKCMRWLFFVMIPLSALIALLTASRQILLIQAPVIISLYAIRYLTKRRLSVLLGGLLVLVLVLSVFGNSISDTYNNSMLSQRNQMSIGEDARTHHLINAMNVGFSSPIWGVGPACYATFSNGYFSHCTYTELFANYGLFAALFYIWIILHFVMQQWNRYKRHNDRMYLSFAVFGLFFAIDNFFYVFYTGMWLMAFFFLVAMHSEIYYKSQVNYHQEI